VTFQNHDVFCRLLEVFSQDQAADSMPGDEATPGRLGAKSGRSLHFVAVEQASKAFRLANLIEVRDPDVSVGVDQVCRWRTLSGVMSVQTWPMYARHSERVPVLSTSRQPLGVWRATGQIEYCSS
jgi:hypothetical protein